MKVFTDGACSCNGMKGSRGSWAAVFPEHPELDCSGLLEGSEQTNNRAEFTAAIKALEATSENLEIMTDSNLLVNVARPRRTLTSWLDSELCWLDGTSHGRTSALTRGLQITTRHGIARLTRGLSAS